MEWIKIEDELPKIPGVYWVHYEGDEQDKIINVELDEKDCAKKMVTICETCDNYTTHALYFCDRWFGPIEKPEYPAIEEVL